MNKTLRELLGDRLDQYKTGENDDGKALYDFKLNGKTIGSFTRTVRWRA